jgi:hypothetical protein
VTDIDTKALRALPGAPLNVKFTYDVVRSHPVGLATAAGWWAVAALDKLLTIAAVAGQQEEDDHWSLLGNR